MRSLQVVTWGRASCLAFILIFIFYIIGSKKYEKDITVVNLLSNSHLADLLYNDTREKDKYTGCFVDNSTKIPLWEQHIDFDHSNITNTTGSPDGCYLVPNYIHYVLFGDKPINYLQLICILAAYKRQKPDRFFFHYDNKVTFSGKYWNVLEQAPGFIQRVIFNEIQIPDEIFGQPLEQKFKAWHGSDIMRIRMIIRYGGIYLDNDCYMVKNIDEFRRFETSVDWDDNEWMGNQVIIAHSDSRFLQKWLNGYRQYNGSEWYYNAGEKPVTDILMKEPHLVHRVKGLFGVNTKYRTKFYQERWQGWRDFYVMHLLARHQWGFRSVGLHARYPVEFTEDNIGYYPVTFRDMAYEVYDVANVNWPKNTFN